MVAQSSTMASLCAIGAGEEELQEFHSCPGSPMPENVPCPEGNVASGSDYEIWTKSMDCVAERRRNFVRRMGWDLDAKPLSLSSDEEGGTEGELIAEDDRIVSDSGAVLGSADTDNACSVSSRWSTSGDVPLEESSEYMIKSLDDGRVFVADEFDQDGALRSVREFGKDQAIPIDEFERSFGPSAFVQKLMRREDSRLSSNSDKSARRRKHGWLKRIGAVACIVDRHVEEPSSQHSDSDPDPVCSSKIHRVKVQPHRKKSKEFSAVFMGQDIKAHDGAILTMKFSPDGQYLASGGEDGVVRIWSVMECDQTEEDELPKDDPSCIYFKVENSELAPLYTHKEKKVHYGSLKRTSDSACVVIPSNVFRIQEKPLHEFYGHRGDILDLSWSKDEHILSSSEDKTVRLWRIGRDSCVEVFSHNNYVTCVQFNPVNGNYFISGSTDGKVRIWEIPRCRVVGWIDTREIVTAVCYCPDGKGSVVGTITGDCRFYDASDNHLRLDARVSLHGRKKSTEKRITGFQFCPNDQRRLMVTSADSQVRILDGVHVVGKYKGLRNAGSQISASFTSDGRHIVSASEDSSVYVWSHDSNEMLTSNHVKSTWSYERFASSNASVAISWNGLKSRNPVPVSSELLPSQQEGSREQTGIQENLHSRADSLGNNNLYLTPSGSFTLSQDFFSEVLHKGCATWPEEKLPSSMVATSALCKSQYMFLKASIQNTSSAWGQVIVTAGWDGRIKSFRNYGLPVHL